MAAVDENYAEKLVNVVAKKIIEVFENLTVEDVKMYQIGYNKAIDEFAEKLKEKIKNKYGSGEINHAYNAKEKTLKLIDEIAEQMKGGAIDG